MLLNTALGIEASSATIYTNPKRTTCLLGDPATVCPVGMPQGIQRSAFS